MVNKQHSILKDSQIAKLVGITKNSVTAIRNKSYWFFNNFMQNPERVIFTKNLLKLEKADGN